MLYLRQKKINNNKGIEIMIFKFRPFNRLNNLLIKSKFHHQILGRDYASLVSQLSQPRNT